MVSKGFVIAIDGPVASGKGTIAKKLSGDLGGFYLYTGAMFRCVALMCIEKNLNLGDSSEVESVLPTLNVKFEKNVIFLNGKDVTNRINESDAASGASVVGVYRSVREGLLLKQQHIAEEEMSKGGIVVAEGRDTGTVVFENAPLKIYLTARPEIRAKRRMDQYVKEDRDMEQELSALKIRDARDQTRVVSPLPSNPEKLGYFILDNSDMSEEETLDVIKKELVDRKLIN